MPTNRPFFSNFLAAFRAHSAIQQGKSASPSQPSHSHSSSSTTTTVSNPRTISTSTKPGATSSALTTLHSPRNHSASPLSHSPDSSLDAGKVVEAGRENRVEGRDIIGGQRYLREGRRRGSDSSSEGFRDVLGVEKWYVGGRTAQGEERYFQLGVVRRRRSQGSLSLDRLSL